MRGEDWFDLRAGRTGTGGEHQFFGLVRGDPGEAAQTQGGRGLHGPSERGLGISSDYIQWRLGGDRIADDAFELGIARGRESRLRHCSEPGNLGEGQLALMDMQPAEFGAAMQYGKDFAGIEQALIVEGAFEALLLVEIYL